MKLDGQETQDKLYAVAKRIFHLRVELFLLILAMMYGFIIWRVTVLSKAQPGQSLVASQTGTPNTLTNISPAVINKITQLQDNSVNAQALFNQARQNPFQE